MLSLFLPHHDIAEILLKCVLNTINQSIYFNQWILKYSYSVLFLVFHFIIEVNFIGGILYFRLKLLSCCKSTVNSLLVEYYTTD